MAPKRDRKSMNILILGGTAEARDLANRLVALGHAVTSSLAGRTQAPILPAGAVRVGGFGGASGLGAYLRSTGIARLVDATHPYAGTISRNAVVAAQESGVPLVRLMRPAWEQPDGADWTIVESAAEAATMLPEGADVLLTTGHTGLDAFFERSDCRFVVRLIEAPALPVPAQARLLQRRPPYGLAEEMDLLEREKITHLVSKNSGGAQTVAKLEAARRLGVKVIMIARPAYGPAIEVSSAEDAITALELNG
jgi:precorrin-6A/cobalt-precorrin-6A reductase